MRPRAPQAADTRLRPIHAQAHGPMTAEWICQMFTAQAGKPGVDARHPAPASSQSYLAGPRGRGT